MRHWWSSNVSSLSRSCFTGTCDSRECNDGRRVYVNARVPSLWKPRSVVHQETGEEEVRRVLIALEATFLHLFVPFFPITLQRHHDRPRLRRHFRIVDGGCKMDRVCIDQGQALGHSQAVAEKIPSAAEPGQAVEIRRLDHEGVALPAAPRVSSPQLHIGREMRTAVHIDDAERVPARFVDDCHVSWILRYLTGTRADHDPWRANRQAVRVRIDVALDVVVFLSPCPRVLG